MSWLNPRRPKTSHPWPPRDTRWLPQNDSRRDSFWGNIRCSLLESRDWRRVMERDWLSRGMPLEYTK